jgi:uncharacterized damage-inducible protein DinB
MPIADMLLPEFDHEMAYTRKMLERVPDDKLGWKPHLKSMDLGALASHVATNAHWVAGMLASESFDFAPPGGPPYSVPRAGSKADLLAKFDQSAVEARAALAGATDQQLVQPWSLLAGGHTVFSMPRVACYRGMVMNHLIHHRGQLSVYLRLLDVPIPGMYGPSADEPNPMAG